MKDTRRGFSAVAVDVEDRTRMRPPTSDLDCRIRGRRSRSTSISNSGSGSGSEGCAEEIVVRGLRPVDPPADGSRGVHPVSRGILHFVQDDSGVFLFH